MKIGQIVTHRCSDEKIERILKEGIIKSGYARSEICSKHCRPKLYKVLLRLEDTRSVVWVSDGRPNLWNRIWSGMINTESYIVFKTKAVSKPNGYAKRMFSWKIPFAKSQLVIVGDAEITDKIVEIKYKGNIYSEQSEIQGLVSRLSKL